MPTAQTASQIALPTLLVVDDDSNIRMLLSFVLRQQYQIATCENGLEALAWLAQQPLPEAILLDMDMPRVNGYALIHQLKASGWYREIPLVVLSGYESLQIKQACLRAGADAYLIKPFNPDQLRFALQKARSEHVV